MIKSYAQINILPTYFEHFLKNIFLKSLFEHFWRWKIFSKIAGLGVGLKLYVHSVIYYFVHVD